MVPLDPTTFLYNWKRKILSFVIACLVWVMVHNSISTTITLNHIPVKIIDLPADRAIEGVSNDGMLYRQISIKVKGDRELLSEINPRDLLIQLSADGKPSHWEPRITKSNLISLDPDLDLSGIRSLRASKLTLEQTPRLKAPIPVKILPPSGDPPEGYHFIDVWPRTLHHTISGPKELVTELRDQGLTLLLDLNTVKKEDLDAIHNTIQQDEISYFVPSRQRRIQIPFLGKDFHEINDPKAHNLRLDFVKSDGIPIQTTIPVLLYFSSQHSPNLQPQALRLSEGKDEDTDRNSAISLQGGVYILSMPLLTLHVSEHFLNTIKNHLSVVITTDSSGKNYSWSLQVIDSERLEDEYVRSQIGWAETSIDQQRQKYLRQRFRNYLHLFNLHTKDGKPLELDIERKGNSIFIWEYKS